LTLVDFYGKALKPEKVLDTIAAVEFKRKERHVEIKLD